MGLSTGKLLWTNMLDTILKKVDYKNFILFNQTLVEAKTHHIGNGMKHINIVFPPTETDFKSWFDTNLKNRSLNSKLITISKKSLVDVTDIFENPDENFHFKVIETMNFNDTIGPDTDCKIGLPPSYYERTIQLMDETSEGDEEF